MLNTISTAIKHWLGYEVNVTFIELKNLNLSFKSVSENFFISRSVTNLQNETRMEPIIILTANCKLAWPEFYRSTPN